MVIFNTLVKFHKFGACGKGSQSGTGVVCTAHFEKGLYYELKQFEMPIWA